MLWPLIVLVFYILTKTVTIYALIMWKGRKLREARVVEYLFYVHLVFGDFGCEIRGRGLEEG